MKCRCPKNCDDIHTNKILDEDTIRCGKKASVKLHCPDLKIHEWPICTHHFVFFGMHGIEARNITGNKNVARIT